MILTKKERSRFIEYLESNVKDNVKLVSLCKEKPNLFPKAMTDLLSRDAMAFTYVANKLKQIED